MKLVALPEALVEIEETMKSVPAARSWRPAPGLHQDAPDEGRSKRQGEGSHDTLIDD